MTETAQRSASLKDLKDIWGLMKGVSGDIPFDLSSEAAQESLLSEIMSCCTSGLSPVALGEDKSVVGALLVRRDDFEWGFRNSDAIHLSYAAIASSHKDKGILGSLIASLQEQKVPIFASVKSGNQFGLADELVKLGFVHECKAESGWGDLYKWQPPSRLN
jgi:hypothetical protein